MGLEKKMKLFFYLIGMLCFHSMIIPSDSKAKSQSPQIPALKFTDTKECKPLAIQKLSLTTRAIPKNLAKAPIHSARTAQKKKKVHKKIDPITQLKMKIRYKEGLLLKFHNDYSIVKRHEAFFYLSECYMHYADALEKEADDKYKCAKKLIADIQGGHKDASKKYAELEKLVKSFDDISWRVEYKTAYTKAKTYIDKAVALHSKKSD